MLTFRKDGKRISDAPISTAFRPCPSSLTCISQQQRQKLPCRERQCRPAVPHHTQTLQGVGACYTDCMLPGEEGGCCFSSSLNKANSSSLHASRGSPPHPKHPHLHPGYAACNLSIIRGPGLDDWRASQGEASVYNMSEEQFAGAESRLD